METPIKDRFLDSYLLNEKRRRKNTIETYKVSLNQLYDFFLEKYKTVNDELSMINCMTRNDFTEYIEYLDTDYDISSINTKIGAWKSFYNYLYESDIIEKNIIKLMKPLEDIKSEDEDLSDMINNINKKEILTKDELHRVIQASYIKGKQERQFEFSSARARFMITLCHTAGLRMHELSNAKFKWLQPIKDGYMLNVPSIYNKNKVKKRVPITGLVLKYYNEYIEERSKLKQCDDNLIIVSNKGKQFNLGDWNKQLSKILNKTNITKHITSHCGRHYFVTEAMQQGVSMPMIYRIGGWKPKLITDEYYCHDNNMDKQKIQICNSLI